MTVPEPPSENSSRPLSILIVGAGIGGLSAALALRKQGHNVTVLEKSRFARETGAAIHLPPNCTVLLEWLGLDPREFDGCPLEALIRYDDQGNLLMHSEFAEVRKHWQAEWYLVHRIDFHNALKTKALADDGDFGPISLHTGCQITGIDPKQASVTLDDGRQFNGDVLVGADGVRSITRKSIWSDISPAATGKTCFRWLCPVGQLTHNPDTANVVKQPGCFIDWRGPRSRLVAYPCSNNKIFNMVAFLPNAEAGCVGEDWQSSGDREKLLSGFSSFALPVRSLTEATDETLKVWKLHDMEPLPTWVKGRTALLGDAAHPFTPFLGQGGAMAVEDGVSIAAMLPLGTDPSEVNMRLKLYEEARRERVETVLNFTRMCGRDDDDPPGEVIKGQAIGNVLEMVFRHNELKHASSILERATSTVDVTSGYGS